MATNFKISSRQEKGSLELRLKGDFDGMSACELLNMLKRRSEGARKVVIHTGGLRRIYPFGKDTFRKNFHLLNDKDALFEFKGKNAGKIGPSGKSPF
jgi:hypothetical protein